MDQEYIRIPLKEKDPKTNLPTSRKIKISDLHIGAYNGNGYLNMCPVCDGIYPHHNQTIEHIESEQLTSYYQQAERNIRENSKFAFIHYPNTLDKACPFECPNHKTVTFVMSVYGRVFCGHCTIDFFQEKLGICEIGSFSQKLNLTEDDFKHLKNIEDKDSGGLRI